MSRHHSDPFSDERSPIMSEASDSMTRPASQSHQSNRGRDWSHEINDVPSVPDMNSPSKILVGCFFLANALSWAVFTALPALFPSFEAQFALSSTELGLMRFIFACSQFLLSPFWSFLSHGKQKRIVITECFVCGCFCIGLSFAPSYASVLGCLAGIGFANGGIFPIAQSYLSDTFPVHQRGRMFGLLNVASFLGVALGFIIATQVPSVVKTPVFTFNNWQVAFLILGILMLKTSILIAFVKHRVDYHNLPEQQPFIQQLKSVGSSSTWRLIVLQGCFGMLPWDAISFMVLWFTLIGFSHQTAGLIMLTAACGAACGAVFGGWVGDKWSRASPDSGRLSIAQISLFLSLPASALFFEAVPRRTSSEALYFFAIFALAFVCNWVGPACNEVIISEVVPRGTTSVAYALDRLFEGFFGSLGTLVVGVVADFQGYSYPTRVDVALVPLALRTKNAAILGNAMLATCLVCWSIAFVIFFFIRKVYPSDRDRLASWRIHTRRIDCSSLTPIRIIMTPDPPQMNTRHAVAAHARSRFSNDDL